MSLADGEISPFSAFGMVDAQAWRVRISFLKGPNAEAR
jgi:hypothetical protein